MSELKAIDMHANNGLLCSFATRWRVDGDYIRCGTCDRPQLSSYADNDFPHAEWCRDKDSPTLERRPWLTYVSLLEPILRRPTPEPQAKAVAWMSKDYNPMFNGGFAWAFHANPGDVGPQHIPLYTRPQPGDGVTEDEGVAARCEEAANRVFDRQPGEGGGEVVTLESAIEAIEHMNQHNGPGRELEAVRMLRRLSKGGQGGG